MATPEALQAENEAMARLVDLTAQMPFPAEALQAAKEAIAFIEQRLRAMDSARINDHEYINMYLGETIKDYALSVGYIEITDQQESVNARLVSPSQETSDPLRLSRLMTAEMLIDRWILDEV